MPLLHKARKTALVQYTHYVSRILYRSTEPGFSTEIKSEHVVARDFVRSKYAKDYRYELLQAANAIIR